MGTRHSLAAISLEMERQKRDAQSRQEQDRVGRQPACIQGEASSDALVRVGSLALPWGCFQVVGKVQPYLRDPKLREEATRSTLVR